MDVNEKTNLVIPVERSRSRHGKRVQAPIPWTREKGASARCFGQRVLLTPRRSSLLCMLLPHHFFLFLVLRGLVSCAAACLPVIASLESSGTFERTKLQDFDVRHRDAHPIGRLS